MRIINVNVSSLFLFPAVNLKSNRQRYIENGFDAAFYKLTNDEELGYLVYALFKPYELDSFNEFLKEEYELNENLIGDISYGKEKIILIYKLNEDFIEDYTRIFNGEYSKISTEYQKCLPKALKIMENGLHKDEISPQMLIIKKSIEYKEMWEKEMGCTLSDDDEVWEGFNNKYEIYENYEQN